MSNFDLAMGRIEEQEELDRQRQPSEVQSENDFSENYQFYPQNNDKTNAFNNVSQFSPNNNRQAKQPYERQNIDQKKNSRPKKKKNEKQYNITNYQSFSLDKLAEVVVPLAKDQMGCRYLQKQLEDNPTFLDMVFPYVIASAEEVTNEPFGNYLVQKVLSLAKLEQISEFIDSIEPKLLDICISPHGTRVVQMIVYKIKKNDVLLAKFTNILYPLVIDLFKDNNGNHIIQKFVKEISFPNNQFIYNILTKNLMELATDKHGCCVIQKCIEEANADQSERLTSMLVEQGPTLILDQYGNYVIQYIIGLRNQEINMKIASFFLTDIYRLSKEKFSSNVIEKVAI